MMEQDAARPLPDATDAVTAHGVRTSKGPVARPGTCCVIGAQGRMGKLFIQRLSHAGCSVSGLDRPLEDRFLAASLPGQDLVLLAVPAPAMDEVLRLCAPHLSPETILADICSVKVQPLRLMRLHHRGPVVGTHPLFGQEPGQEGRVALTPGRGDAELEMVAALLRKAGFEPFTTTAQDHDRAMAAVQGLNFVTTCAYLSSLAGDEKIRDFLTPSFVRRLDAARKMFTEDRTLFADLFEANPYSQDAVRLFRSHLNIAAGGDIDMLAQRAGWWWREQQSGGETGP